MPYFIAIDGGAKKTHALCANEHGQVVAEGQSGPASVSVTSLGAASFNLREAIRQCVEVLPQGERIEQLVMGLAGMDTPSERQQAEAIFADVFAQFPIASFGIVNEVVIALESGTDKPDALVIISNTGSNCYGRNAEGQEARTGGMDYLLTDQGSGYIIGRQVLREAVKSFDGRRPKSVLEALVCEHFHISSIAELKDVVQNPPLSKTEIAQLVAVGLAALNQGDAVAKALFDHANDSLVSMAATVIKRLGMQDRPIDCVMVGDTLHIPYIYEHFRENMLFVCNQISIIEPTQEPVYGALKMALRRSTTSRS